jgi:hypothetical protein
VCVPIRIVERAEIPGVLDVIHDEVVVWGLGLHFAFVFVSGEASQVKRPR